MARGARCPRRGHHLRRALTPIAYAVDTAGPRGGRDREPRRPRLGVRRRRQRPHAAAVSPEGRGSHGKSSAGPEGPAPSCLLLVSWIGLFGHAQLARRSRFQRRDDRLTRFFERTAADGRFELFGARFAFDEFRVFLDAFALGERQFVRRREFPFFDRFTDAPESEPITEPFTTTATAPPAHVNSASLPPLPSPCRTGGYRVVAVTPPSVPARTLVSISPAPAFSHGTPPVSQPADFVTLLAWSSAGHFTDAVPALHVIFVPLTPSRKAAPSVPWNSTFATVPRFAPCRRTPAPPRRSPRARRSRARPTQRLCRSFSSLPLPTRDSVRRRCAGGADAHHLHRALPAPSVSIVAAQSLRNSRSAIGPTPWRKATRCPPLGPPLAPGLKTDCVRREPREAPRCARP